MEFLLQGLSATTWQQLVMYVIGSTLIYLAISKKLEPALLLPMGFGAILVNIPFSGALNGTMPGIGEVAGILEWMFEVGIEASEAMPLLLFIGIGAMIDFGPLLSNPKLVLFGAAAQFGIFATISIAALMGFPLKDAASIGIIGAADGPTSILVSQVLNSDYVGAIAVAAYSVGADYPTVRHTAGDNQKGTGDPHALQSQERLTHVASAFPHRRDDVRRICRPGVGESGRAVDVRKPYP